jgi:hypothetical protein
LLTTEARATIDRASSSAVQPRHASPTGEKEVLADRHVDRDQEYHGPTRSGDRTGFHHFTSPYDG